MNIYDFTVKDNSGTDVSLSKYKGKVLLVVNTATGCGFTPQYKGLQELYDKYKEKGFEILDFPCNQFANQAPGTDAEITEFCTLRYKTSLLVKNLRAYYMGNYNLSKYKKNLDIRLKVFIKFLK